MRVAAALFVAAAAFAWLTAHGVLQLEATRATPPVIVLRPGGGVTPPSAVRRFGRVAVLRKVELAPLRAFRGRQGARP